jgi:hypothetical protein
VTCLALYAQLKDCLSHLLRHELWPKYCGLLIGADEIRLGLIQQSKGRNGTVDAGDNIVADDSLSAFEH